MSDQPAQSCSTRASLRARQAELVRRLDDGDQQISEAKRNGTDVARWEDHWISLLQEYEAVCRQLGDAIAVEFPAAA